MALSENDRSLVIALAGVMTTIAAISCGALFAFTGNHELFKNFVPLSLLSAIGVALALDHICDQDEEGLNLSFFESIKRRLGLYGHGYLFFVLVMASLLFIVLKPHHNIRGDELNQIVTSAHFYLTCFATLSIGGKMMTQNDKNVFLFMLIIASFLAWGVVEIAWLQK